MLLAECWLWNKRYYLPFYRFEFIERLWEYLIRSGIYIAKSKVAPARKLGSKKLKEIGII